MSFLRKEVPKITVGKYAGTPIDQLPNGYLRWMLTQDFPKLWLDIARDKLAKSPYNNDCISVSRHCLDQYSLRFLDRWVPKSFNNIGLGTFVAIEAEKAWKDGANISKHRHQDDGIAKIFDGIVWIFNQNPTFPDYLDVITCYPK